MGYFFKGSVLAADDINKTRISDAEVRLYSKSNGSLIETTTSSVDGRWTIDSTTFHEAPWKYFCVAYTEDFSAGVVDLWKTNHCISFRIGVEIVDENTDLIKIDLPNVSDITILQMVVQSTQNATANGSMELRNSSGGAGSAITVNITANSKYFSGEGSLTTTDYFWIRSIGQCGLADTGFDIYYLNALMTSPF